jgi:ABC-2 type transport system ATP-binding protein
VRKRFGATIALDGFDLRVEPGEHVGLLGPNGAGKSTLAKIACGLVRPDAGEVRIAGQRAGSRRARSRVGYLAELFRFPESVEVEELLVLHQRLAGSAGGAAERRDLLELVGLPTVGGRRIGGLSKGMQQRLGIAQALVGSPELVLLDEPTSALDPVGRRAVREILEDLRRRGVAVVLNSHGLTEVELTCDRVVIVRAGRVVGGGRIDELLAPRAAVVRTATREHVVPGAGEDELPRLVRELVDAGEDVLGASVRSPTLEELYLEAMSSPVDPASP